MLYLLFYSFRVSIDKICPLPPVLCIYFLVSTAYDFTMAASNGEIARESDTIEPWQAYMKDVLEPDSDGIDEAVLTTLRDLLLAPDTDNQRAAQAAAQKLLNLYRDSYPKRDFGFYRTDDKGARGFLDSVSIPVVELATHFRWDSASHQRLADTMIALRDGCTKEFKEDDPQLVYIPDGVLTKVDGAWNAYSSTQVIFTPSHTRANSFSSHYLWRPASMQY